jgi:2-alkyl-3-oxoalkanoate reductase
MKALVTGGGGFLGRYIVEQLIRQGHSVRILARGDYRELKNQGVECIRGDIRDSSVVLEAVDGMDCVFHVAALAGLWGARDLFFSINVNGTRNIISACQKRKVARLVYTSSPSVIFDMQDQEGVDETHPYPKKFYAHYAETKSIAERMVLAANSDSLATCALRPHLIWGPRDPHVVAAIIERAKSGQLIQIGNGANRVDITYVENAAHAHLQAAEVLSPDSPVAGRVYFISDDYPVSLWQWIGELLTAMSLPPVRRRIPYAVAYALAGILEFTHSLFPSLGEPRLTRFLAGEFAKSHFYDIRRAKADFGYRVIIDRQEGIKRTVEWFSKVSQT